MCLGLVDPRAHTLLVTKAKQPESFFGTIDEQVIVLILVHLRDVFSAFTLARLYTMSDLHFSVPSGNLEASQFSLRHAFVR